MEEEDETNDFARRMSIEANKPSPRQLLKKWLLAPKEEDKKLEKIVEEDNKTVLKEQQGDHVVMEVRFFE